MNTSAADSDLRRAPLAHAIPTSRGVHDTSQLEQGATANAEMYAMMRGCLNEVWGDQGLKKVPTVRIMTQVLVQIYGNEAGLAEPIPGKPGGCSSFLFRTITDRRPRGPSRLALRSYSSAPTITAPLNSSFTPAIRRDLARPSTSSSMGIRLAAAAISSED